MDEARGERLDEIFRSDASSVAYRVEALQAYLRDFPDRGWVWAMLGKERIDLSRFGDAEDALGRALQLLSPDDHYLVYCPLGELFQHRGDPAAADAWFRKAIALRPDEATAYIFQGGMWARLGRLDEAEASHRRGTRCTIGCVWEAHHNLGLVLRAQGRYAEASDSFDEALRLNPQYKQARLAKRDVEHAMQARRRPDEG